jgi:SAM domain (Sterile alpha motif)
MDIVVWLRSLGLGKYEAAFRENEIDETVLPSLTHETLKELGVTAVGHRLKLLDAIAALRNDASGKTPSVDATTTSSAPSAAEDLLRFKTSPGLSIMGVGSNGLVSSRRRSAVSALRWRLRRSPLHRETRRRSA